MRRAGANNRTPAGRVMPGRYPAVGEVGDQHRGAVRAVADRPAQLRFLTHHEGKDPPQPFVVGFDRNWDVWCRGRRDRAGLIVDLVLTFGRPGHLFLDPGLDDLQRCLRFGCFWRGGGLRGVVLVSGSPMPTPVILVVIDRQHRIDHRLQFGFLECGRHFESGGLGFGFDRWWFRRFW